MEKIDDVRIKVDLSIDDASKLACFLLMSSHYRREEAESWKRLAGELNEDGTPAFPAANSNAAWYRDLEPAIERVRHAIDAACIA